MVKKINSKKSQGFSVDIIIVMIVILVAVVFLITNRMNVEDNSNEKLNNIYEEATVESKTILIDLQNKNIVDEKNNLDAERLLNLDYDEIRAELNLNSDFAIILEKDGKLIKMNPSGNTTCYGSDKIIVNGMPCTVN